MIVGVKLKAVRECRRLRSGELARLASVSIAEISLIEKGHRTPGVDILQKLAAALEVRSSFLLNEEDADLPLQRALARQSLGIFMREARLSKNTREYLEKVSALDSAPDTVKGWRDLIANIRAIQPIGRSGARRIRLNSQAQQTYVGTKPDLLSRALQLAREKRLSPGR